jgi:hypothetical protein
LDSKRNFYASFPSKICKNSKTLTGAGIPAGQKFSTGTGPDRPFTVTGSISAFTQSPLVSWYPSPSPSIATFISEKNGTRLPTMLIFLWMIELVSATKWHKNIEEKSLALDTSS